MSEYDYSTKQNKSSLLNQRRQLMWQMEDEQADVMMENDPALETNLPQARAKVNGMSDEDEKKILHLLEGFESRAQINMILSIMSTYSDEEIIASWKTTGFERKILQFTSRFNNPRHFTYPREIAAVFRAIDSSVRIIKIRELLSNGIIKAPTARYIFYYMQGLSDEEIASVTRGYESLAGAYERFLAALQTADIERLEAAVAEFKLSSKDEDKNIAELNEEVEKVKNDIVDVLSEDENDKKHILKKIGKGKVAKIGIDNDNNAIRIYYILKNTQTDVLAAFVSRYPVIIEEMEFYLPLELRNTSTFGINPGIDKKATQKTIVDFKELYKIAAPYNFLYANPAAFLEYVDALNTNETSLINKFTIHYSENLDNDQLADLFDPAISSVINMKNSALLDDDGLRYKKATDLLKAKLMKSNPDLEKATVNQPELLELAIKNTNEATKIISDDNYATLYFGAKGILDGLQQADIWTNNNELKFILSMIVQAGLGAEAYSIVNDNRAKTDNDGRAILGQYGFLETGFVLSSDEPHASPMAYMKIVEDFVRSPGEKSLGKEISTKRALWWLLWHPADLKQLVMNGLYFGEGMAPGLEFAKKAQLNDFSLSDTQKYLGGTIAGTQFGDKSKQVPALYKGDIQKYAEAFKDVSKDAGDLTFLIDEKQGIANILAYHLPIESINMQLGSMTMRSKSGELIGLQMRAEWPVKKDEDMEASTVIRLAVLEMNNLSIIDNESVLGIGKMVIKDIEINLDQAIGNKKTMGNWVRVIDQIINLLYNVSMVMMDSVFVSADRFFPNIDMGDPGKELTNIVLNAYEEHFEMSIRFGDLLIEDLYHSKYGYIQKIGMTESTISANSGHTIGQLQFGVEGSSLNMEGINMSGVASNQLGTGEFSTKSIIKSEGAWSNKKSRTNRRLNALAATSTGEEKPENKTQLKRVEFNFADITSDPEGISIGGSVTKIPVSDLSGWAEFSDDNRLKVNIDNITNVNFFNLPVTSDNLSFVTNPDSYFAAENVSFTLDIGLNTPEDQEKNGLVMQSITVNEMDISHLHGNKFEIVQLTNGVETRIQVNNEAFFGDVVLRDAVLEKSKNEDSGENELKLKSIGLFEAKSSSITDLVAKLPNGMTENLDKFTSGRLFVQQIKDGNGHVIYDFGAENITDFSGAHHETAVNGKTSTVEYQLNDKEQQPFNFKGNYDQTANSMTVADFTIPEVQLPYIDYTTADGKTSIRSTATGGRNVILNNIKPDLTVYFNNGEDKETRPFTHIEIRKLNILDLQTYGLVVSINGTTITMPPDDLAYVTGLYIENYKINYTSDAEGKVISEQELMYSDENESDKKYLPAKMGVAQTSFIADKPGNKIVLKVKDQFEASLSSITSGGLCLEWVEGGGYKYSASNLDAKGSSTKQKTKASKMSVTEQFKIDTRTIDGTYKETMEGTGDSAHKVITESSSVDIEELKIPTFNLDSDKLKINIPAGSKGLTIKELQATVETTTINPSVEETRAATDKKQTIKPKTTITVKSLDMDQMKAYGLYIQQKNQKKDANDKLIKDAVFELDLANDEAATINYLDIDEMKIAGKKITGSVSVGKRDDGATATGFKLDDANINIEDNIKDTMLDVFDVPVQADKITYDANADGSINIKVDKPKITEQKNGKIKYSFRDDKNNDDFVQIFNPAGDALNNKLLSAGSVTVNIDKEGNQTIKVTNPTLNKLAVVHDNSNYYLSGKIIGDLTVKEQKGVMFNDGTISDAWVIAALQTNEAGETVPADVVLTDLKMEPGESGKPKEMITIGGTSVEKGMNTSFDFLNKANGSVAPTISGVKGNPLNIINGDINIDRMGNSLGLLMSQLINRSLPNGFGPNAMEFFNWIEDYIGPGVLAGKAEPWLLPVFKGLDKSDPRESSRFFAAVVSVELSRTEILAFNDDVVVHVGDLITDNTNIIAKNDPPIKNQLIKISSLIEYSLNKDGNPSPALSPIWKAISLEQLFDLINTNPAFITRGMIKDTPNGDNIKKAISAWIKAHIGAWLTEDLSFDLSLKNLDPEAISGFKFDPKNKDNNISLTSHGAINSTGIKVESALSKIPAFTYSAEDKKTQVSSTGITLDKTIFEDKDRETKGGAEITNKQITISGLNIKRKK